jgi:hypothetical protein
MQMAQVKQNSDPNSISTVGTAGKLGNQHQLNSEPLKFDTEDHGEIFGEMLIRIKIQIRDWDYHADLPSLNLA